MSHYVSDVTVFDGRTVKTKQGVHVAGGTIEWAGAHARAPRVARAAAELPGADRLLMPGLIDCHVHLVFDGQADFEQEAKELTPALAAIKAANNARRNLDAGVTTVRDLGGLGSVSCEVGGAIERGLISGPRVLAAGRALTVTGGHGHNIGIAREVDGPDAVRRAVREEIRGGARAIKLMATGGVLTPGIGATFTAYSQEEIAAAVDEAHKWGRSVAAHAIGAGGILNAVRAGVDSIEHCNDVTAEVAREMKERGTFRSPTLCALRGITEHPDEVPDYAVRKAVDTMEMSRGGMRRALREGVRHVCGTDAGTPFNPHGSAPREIVSMVQWGMTPLKALQAATANGAELLGLTMAGRIHEGAEADLVLYEGNPLDEIERVLAPVVVMRAGDVVAGALD
jgi:imidazolonepropionase-like amidohydrolase